MLQLPLVDFYFVRQVVTAGPTAVCGAGARGLTYASLASTLAFNKFLVLLAFLETKCVDALEGLALALQGFVVGALRLAI